MMQEINNPPYLEKRIIGNCILYLGDCMRVLPDIESFDIAMFDPPYKMEIHGRGFAAKRDYYKELDYGTSTEFELSDDFYKLLTERQTEKNIGIFCNKLMKLDILNWAVANDYTFDEIPMCKTAPAPLTNNQWLPDKEWFVHLFRGLKIRGDYSTKRSFFIDTNYQDKTVDHPSPKPLRIIEKILHNISEPNQTVLDVFMGSGTTGVACAKLGRKFIGIEINKDYFQLSCDRIQAFYDQPDLFIEKNKPVQNDLLMESK